MLKKLIILISVLIGITVGTFSANLLITNGILINKVNINLLRILIISLITILFFIASLLLADKLVVFLKKIEEKLSKIPLSKIIFTTLGFILGLILATLLMVATFSIVSISGIASAISAIFYIVFGYLGFILGYRRGAETLNIFSNKIFVKNKSENIKLKEINVTTKVMDTSALIDSRIHDIASTGFLEGNIIVPEFVLKELQLIADSEDSIKRSKGRLGLDCVEELKKILGSSLIIDNKYKYRDNDQVDSLLINYALKNKYTIVTTDYNLNKLATLQSIKVLNVNDLSNAVKPILITGEKLTVRVQKEGKENNQGVAYTEDGTMLVVENGKKYVGKDIEVVVQSVLQTSSGRIIFTKIL